MALGPDRKLWHTQQSPPNGTTLVELAALGKLDSAKLAAHADAVRDQLDELVSQAEGAVAERAHPAAGGGELVHVEPEGREPLREVRRRRAAGAQHR